MSQNSINMDAQWLRDLADKIDQSYGDEYLGLGDYDIARLRNIANNLEKMDERLAANGHTPLSFDEGFIKGMATVYARSNMPLGGTIKPEHAPQVLEALGRAPIRRIPQGVRALDESGLPATPFSGAKPKQKKEPKANKYGDLGIDLDI